MTPGLQRIVGSLAGVGFCVATITAVEKLGHWATGAPRDPAQATTPMLLWVLAAWVLGSTIGGFMGFTIARWRGAAWIAAAVVLAGVIATLVSIPTPWWLGVGGIILPLLAAWLVTRLPLRVTGPAS